VIGGIVVRDFIPVSY